MCNIIWQWQHEHIPANMNTTLHPLVNKVKLSTENEVARNRYHRHECGHNDPYVSNNLNPPPNIYHTHSLLFSFSFSTSSPLRLSNSMASTPFSTLCHFHKPSLRFLALDRSTFCGAPAISFPKVRKNRKMGTLPVCRISSAVAFRDLDADDFRHPLDQQVRPIYFRFLHPSSTNILLLLS